MFICGTCFQHRWSSSRVSGKNQSGRERLRLQKSQFLFVFLLKHNPRFFKLKWQQQHFDVKAGKLLINVNVA